MKELEGKQADQLKRVMDRLTSLDHDVKHYAEESRSARSAYKSLEEKHNQLITTLKVGS